MKAYDRGDWSFLMQILKKFGFHEKWCKWIYLSGAMFYVLINGIPSRFFNSSQGVRQGDPLSPFLIIVLTEALSRSVKKAHLEGKWKGIHFPNTRLTITHSLFFDDTILFGMSTIDEAKKIKEVLQRDSLASGQKVNSSK